MKEHGEVWKEFLIRVDAERARLLQSYVCERIDEAGRVDDAMMGSCNNVAAE